MNWTRNLILLTALPAVATTYYVAPDGSDSNPGTSIAEPFATPQKAVTLSALAPGDTIYIRGGTYAMNIPVKPSQPGVAGNLIRLWAFPGEKPVFDFGEMGGSNKALDLRRGYWHARGIEVKNAPNNGIFVGGAGNVVEGCVIHDCNNDGLAVGSTGDVASDTLILNCDSYRNHQVASHGNNGDGFAAKAGCGPGNVFKGCRAWDNADDGWDFYNNNNSVVLIDCWAMRSGYDLWGVGSGWKGNGNGFKLGVGKGQHTLTNCVAFGNRSKGFDQNHSTAGQTVVNCTGYSNNVNFSFYETPTIGQNLLINNLAFGGTAAKLDRTTITTSNSWEVGGAVSEDFASLDSSMTLLPRNPDYTLQTNAFLRLAPGSGMIDRGTDVDLPYNGAAPDLGAFEFVSTASGTDTKGLSTQGLPEGKTSSLHSAEGGQVNVDEIRVGTEGKDVAPATLLLTYENTIPLNLLLQYTPKDEERAEEYKHYITQELGDLVYGIQGTGAARAITQTIVVPPNVIYDGKGEVLTADAKAMGAALGDQSERQKPLFLLTPGAGVKDVTITSPGCEGIHMMGDNVLDNITWEDVGEDAASVRSYFLGGKITIRNSRGFKAADKMFQFNTSCNVRIENFVGDDMGKFLKNMWHKEEAPFYIDLNDVTVTNVVNTVILIENPKGYVRHHNFTCTFRGKLRPEKVFRNVSPEHITEY